MRTITIRQLSVNLFKELQDLPLEVTRYGKVYCRILKVPDEEEKAKKYKDLTSTGPIHQESPKSRKASAKPLSLMPATEEGFQHVPKPKFIKEFKARIPLSKEMEEKLLHPGEKVGLDNKRGELDPDNYV